MNQKAYDILGLAQRAGKVQSGDAAAEAVLKKGQGKLLIIASDASDKTKQHYINLAKLKNVPYVTAGSKSRLGISLGKSPRSIIIITEDNFALRLQELFGRAEDNI